MLQKKQDMTMPTIEELNLKISDDIGGHLFNEHKIALDLLSGRKGRMNESEIKYYLYNLQDISNFIPASQEFMSNVKRVFKEQQANFTIQNYLTWHYIDSILLTYFNDTERFNKFKECASTDLDMIFVNALEKMLQCVSEYSVDEIRYMYFVDTIPKLLPFFHFYKTSKLDTEKYLDTIVETRTGANKVPIEALQASLFVFRRNVLMRMHVENVLRKRKSAFGASSNELNNPDILYRGYNGLIKPLEQGPISIKNIRNISDISSYFENRRNAYNLLYPSDTIKAAYINNTIVGVMGTRNNIITTIHVDGDYRYKGIAKALLNSFLDNKEFLTALPVGDSMSFIKKVGKYSKKLNKAVITKETLNEHITKTMDISTLHIIDSDEPALNVAGEQFKKYIIDNFNTSELSVKQAFLGDTNVGYIIYDKNNRIIVAMEVKPEFRGQGIGTKLLDKIVDYNIWTTDIAGSGVVFWLGKGVTSGYKVYLCSSDKRLKKFAKENHIDTKAVPKMHLD